MQGAVEALVRLLAMGEVELQVRSLIALGMVLGSR